MRTLLIVLALCSVASAETYQERQERRRAIAQWARQNKMNPREAVRRFENPRPIYPGGWGWSPEYIEADWRHQVMKARFFNSICPQERRYPVPLPYRGYYRAW